MKETGYQFIAVLVLLNQWIPSILSQNLVPNPSFEVYDTCPDNWLQFGDPFPSIPWVQGNGASADYFNICAPWQTVGVPVNYFGVQDAVSGYAYGGFFGRAGPDDYREYIMAPLDTPLTAGVGYYVFLYVSPSDDRCAIKTIGALFTRDPPEYGVIDGPLMYFPQIEVNGEFLNDYDNWTRISGCFVAEGGERYITIGNFRNDNFTPVDPDCESINFPESAYYYLDSVSVVESPWSEGELDNLSVTACYSVEVSPGVLAENYLWSDGTTNPTIVVTESGTYYVTVSTECAFQTGAIEVTILQGSDPVTLPDDSIYLCAGETIEISLDPESGEYLWQDGTTGWNYTISTEGIYSVTLSDGCDLTSDQVYVEYLEAPEPFSLGTDTFLCPGSIIQYVFDPTLGQFTWQDGSDAPAYIADAPGLYSLTITNMCGQSQDEIFISGIFPPVFALGQSPTIFCDGDSILIELDPQLGTFEWHDGSTINTFVVSESGYVSVTVTNECYSLSDEIEVYVFETPQFALGQDTSLCPGQLPLSVDLSAVPFAESYLWSDGSTMAIHDIDTAGSHSVTISNDCFSFEDTIDVTVLDNAPDLVLPPDQLLCPGQTFVLDAGGLMGTYQWSTSTGSMTDADTFLVTEPGTYYLTVTNICGSGSDSININYVPPLAPPDLGADFSLCPGETGVLYAGVENVNYLWSEGTTGTVGTADSIVITSPGIYSVQISDACTSAADTIVITSNTNPPDVDLPDTLDLCQGDSIVVEAGITGVQYLWEDGTQLSSVIVNSTGVYALTVSNACGSDTDSVLVNDAGSAPLVSLGDDIALCSGDTVTVIPQSMHVESWLWHDSTTASSIDISAAGIIHVQGVNQCGTAADTLIVTMLPDAPTLDLGADLSLCPGETVTLSITEPEVEILWNDQSTGDQFVVDAEGLVYATISNACGSSSDTVVVELLPDVPALDLGADQSLCPGETITIDPGIADVEYLWQDGSDASNYQTNVPGLIILTISNACGASTDSVIVIEDTNGPQVDLGPDILACEGDTVVLQSGISGVTYLWQDGTSAPHFIAVQSGMYHLQVSNTCGIDTDTIEVDMRGTIPTPELGADTTLCDGEILILNSDADTETIIEWQDGTNDLTYVVSAAGIYILYESNHCGSAADSIVVGYKSAPLPFDLGEDVVLCLGESIVLNAPVTADILTWQDGSHGSSFIADAEQIYSLVISNDCGEMSDEVDVSFDTNEPILDLGPSQALCPGQSVTLEVTQSFAAGYMWSTGSTLSTLLISQPDVYTVTVSTECYSVEDEISIEEEDCASEIFVPNIFSPNGNNINDEWVVLINDPSIVGVECRIFDRWGDVVYESKEAPIVWDGAFNGKNVLPGVYVYMILLVGSNGETRILSGDITVIQ